MAAGAGTSYIVGRMLYFSGYSTGNPDKRLRGAPVYGAGFLALLVTCAKIALVAALARISSCLMLFVVATMVRKDMHSEF